MASALIEYCCSCFESSSAERRNRTEIDVSLISHPNSKLWTDGAAARRRKQAGLAATGLQPPVRKNRHKSLDDVKKQGAQDGSNADGHTGAGALDENQFDPLQNINLKKGGEEVKEQLKRVTTEFLAAAKDGVNVTVYYNDVSGDAFPGLLRIAGDLKSSITRLGVINTPTAPVVFHFTPSNITALMEGCKEPLTSPSTTAEGRVQNRTLRLELNVRQQAALARAILRQSIDASAYEDDPKNSNQEFTPDSVSLVFTSVRERRAAFAALSILKVLDAKQQGKSAAQRRKKKKKRDRSPGSASSSSFGDSSSSASSIVVERHTE